jgi:hypothetical protein
MQVICYLCVQGMYDIGRQQQAPYFDFPTIFKLTCNCAPQSLLLALLAMVLLLMATAIIVIIIYKTNNCLGR